MHQDPMEIFVSAVDVINEVLLRSSVSVTQIIGLGITTQRETTLLFDRDSGKPLTEAIVWQSNETADVAKKYSDYEELIKKRTGLTISPYFSCSKIRYLLDKYELQKRAENGEIGFATVDTWLIYKLTGGKSFLTDTTNASRTGLFDISSCRYDEDLLKIYGIPGCLMPQVLSSTDFFGETNCFSQGPLQIMGDAGDQQCSLLGHRLYRKGQIKMTYGTGLFALFNTGDKAVFSQQGLLTTVALDYNHQVFYALEGSVFIGGAAVQWLRDQLEMIKLASESEQCAQASNDDSLVVVPAFNGLGTPYWDSRCRGAVFGLTRGSNRCDFVKATLEGIAFEANDVLSVMKKEAQAEIKELHVDGGATENNYLMQFQSDITNCMISRPNFVEMTSLGAAFLVGLTAKVFPNLYSLDALNLESREFTPRMSNENRREKIARYERAVAAARMFE